MAFSIKRGTNIYQWCSEGSKQPIDLTEAEARRIAGFGFDHVRIPIFEYQLYDRRGYANAQAFKELEQALACCEKAGLRAAIDLHTLYSHYFMDVITPRLFTDPSEEARFASIWRGLSARLRHHPNDLVAYELLNEAVAADPEDWNRVAMAAFAAVREMEPERTIVLGSNYFNQTHTFHSLKVPDDRNVILTFHYYRPMLVTHHQAKWWQGGFYAGPNHYPGAPIAPEDLKYLSEEFLAEVPQWSNEPYDITKMLRDIQEPLGVAKKAGLPLYCGEFGCILKTPQPIRLAWYRDFLKALKDNSISLANWDYCSDQFGIFTRDGKDTGILELLLG